jgi:thiol-disulfide isomerase/thioredoxin
MNSAIQSRFLDASFLCFLFGVAIMCPLNHPRANEPDDPTATEQLADVLEASYGETPPPEGARMLMAILRGSRMGPGEGWFGPAASRYGYEWLLERHAGDDGTGGISRDRFAGSDELFAVLDRDRDGVIRVVDLDWSDDNPYVQLSYALNRIFRRLDADGSGGLSRDDWANIFATATAGGDTMSAEDFAATLLAGEGGGFMPGDAPTKESLLKGLLAGEIGSMVEGPRVGDRAPVFQLRSPQGGEPLSLDSLMGEKPLVLVFGNFTCGPFRAFYPAVDALHAAYGDRVNFLMVYVREAHPENGWKMASNERAGVAVVQPRSLEERAEVAAAFCSRLEPRMTSTTQWVMPTAVCRRGSI